MRWIDTTYYINTLYEASLANGVITHTGLAKTIYRLSTMTDIYKISPKRKICMILGALSGQLWSENWHIFNDLGRRLQVSYFFGIKCRSQYKLQIRNPDVESYRLVYKWVDSEEVKRGGRSRGGREILGGCFRVLLGHFHEILICFYNPQLKPVRLAPWLGIWIKGGSGCLVTEMHGIPPSRPRGCVQAN